MIFLHEGVVADEIIKWTHEAGLRVEFALPVPCAPNCPAVRLHARKPNHAIYAFGMWAGFSSLSNLHTTQIKHGDTLSLIPHMEMRPCMVVNVHPNDHAVKSANLRH